ncbi:MAG: Lrp/AsnC family transcriptional regulator [Ignavibacteria bacterium]|nr:Lrp/AsnC family transcriptional regulator [Ignavibacteria bacterium]
MVLDETDKKVLSILQTNSKITNAQLASEVGISPSSMLERVKRLENAKVITNYVALVDPEKVGIGTVALVSISLAVHQLDSVDNLTKKLNEFDEVLDCYHIAGEEDFLLRVAVKDIRKYQDFVLNKLSKIPAINRIKTAFVLSTVKSQTRISLDNE